MLMTFFLKKAKSWLVCVEVVSGGKENALRGCEVSGLYPANPHPGMLMWPACPETTTPTQRLQCLIPNLDDSAEGLKALHFSGKWDSQR